MNLFLAEATTGGTRKLLGRSQTKDSCMNPFPSQRFQKRFMHESFWLRRKLWDLRSLKVPKTRFTHESFLAAAKIGGTRKLLGRSQPKDICMNLFPSQRLKKRFMHESFLAEAKTGGTRKLLGRSRTKDSCEVLFVP